MKKIMPVFKDEKDKVVAVAMIIASMFLVFVPALLVVLFGKSYVSESTYEISKAFFNFELLLFLISLVFVIPVVGWILQGFIVPLLTIVGGVLGLKRDIENNENMGAELLQLITNKIKELFTYLQNGIKSKFSFAK